jgi:16S rRNA processing protein RimM
MIARKDCILAGEITKKWGYDGELIIRLATESDPDFRLPESVFVEIQGKLIPFFIASSRRQGKSAMVVHFLDTTETLLKRMLQQKVFIPLPPEGSPSGSLIAASDQTTIIGYDVTDKKMGSIGKVQELIDREIQPLLSVQFNGTEILIPFAPEIIQKIDHHRRKIRINAPDGLIDLYLNP